MNFMVWFTIGTGQKIPGSFPFLFFRCSVTGIRMQPGNTRQEWKAYTMLFDYGIKSMWYGKSIEAYILIRVYARVNHRFISHQ
ncbi:hypothetical protein A3860_10085 [Niastella vici]|uniref:Uncharacterized protein n=1 Tax=Niastella vici TaxID=1703345 RepID=A0A1V9FF55_9BACT|nr:hypothetical protein A3860_10085 [Niastella vici]